MKKLFIEKWKSSAKSREDHYFIDNKKNEYLFGYNPKYINKSKLKKILEIIWSK